MIDEGGDAWTLFFFWKRTKTWSMVSLTGQLKAISTSIMDLDGGWWTKAMKGIGLHSHLDHPGKVIATVDCVVLHEDRVLLIKRGKTPFKEMWALPGGRIEQRDTDVLSAAYRELKEETNIDGTSVNLKYFRTIGNNTRDPRGFALTNVFVAKVDTMPEGIRAGDDAVDHKWFPINALPDVAFDHRDIISAVNATSITYQCGPVERID
jgi:8-oxo-dGTP diphosphatase